MTDRNVAIKKREAVQVLRKVDGVGGVGIGWDDAGHQVLQVEVAPGTDQALVQRHLEKLDVPFVLNTINGFAKTW